MSGPPPQSILYRPIKHTLEWPTIIKLIKLILQESFITPNLPWIKRMMWFQPRFCKFLKTQFHPPNQHHSQFYPWLKRMMWFQPRDYCTFLTTRDYCTLLPKRLLYVFHKRLLYIIAQEIVVRFSQLC